MTRAVNDATLQKAGDIYQYLIALRDCFELNDGDTLQIETNGDVSIINDVGGRFQREVKHHFGNTSISDRDMGSGANWVSCHIALFLSFLRFFATQDNSPMPLVMFFDQPSQVYFPQGNDKDEITQADLIAVNKMYKTIFDEINSIGEDTGILPQIIIVDHVDGKNLECKEEFERYIRCNWRNDTGLI